MRVCSFRRSPKTGNAIISDYRQIVVKENRLIQVKLNQ
ncbi:Uncharacterized protein dnm_090010 [Desulfonema magnum]|uniref:Uncharacterized protein n=1 Tax=Desulfonema magnum TaxID=45655 RepID=A0A975GU80_9BACT|nr:Uncharacterized protein dnm_090010 [Desulfonema magnum]